MAENNMPSSKDPANTYHIKNIFLLKLYIDHYRQMNFNICLPPPQLLLSRMAKERISLLAITKILNITKEPIVSVIFCLYHL